MKVVDLYLIELIPVPHLKELKNSNNPEITHIPIKIICWRVDQGYFENRQCCQFFLKKYRFAGKLSPSTVFKISGCFFFCILFTTKLSRKLWNRFFGFSPSNFFTAFQIKKKILDIFFVCFRRAVKTFEAKILKSVLSFYRPFSCKQNAKKCISISWKL